MVPVKIGQIRSEIPIKDGQIRADKWLYVIVEIRDDLLDIMYLNDLEILEDISYDCIMEDTLVVDV
jgi:hypothetical protein